jgi:hypothetical protein
MATRGNSNQIIVGAAQLFVSKQGPLEYNTANDIYGFSASPTVRMMIRPATADSDQSTQRECVKTTQNGTTARR